MSLDAETQRMIAESLRRVAEHRGKGYAPTAQACLVVAIRKIREAVMVANAAVALHGKY